jgi:hypothetical protein
MQSFPGDSFLGKMIGATFARYATDACWFKSWYGEIKEWQLDFRDDPLRN